MRFALVVMLMIGSAVAFGFDCDVICPKGYTGGCLKSDGGCSCSCRQNASDVKDDILRALSAANASDEVQRQARQLLSQQTVVPRTTLTERIGRQFSIFVKKQD